MSMVTVYPMRGHIVRAMHGWAPYLPPGLFCGHTLSCEPHSEVCLGFRLGYMYFAQSLMMRGVCPVGRTSRSLR